MQPPRTMSKDKARHKHDGHGKRGAEYEPESGDIEDAIKLSDDELAQAMHKKPNEQAFVIAANREGAGVEIVINRGRIDGITSGDAGIVAGLNTRFTIHTVSEKNCVAFVEATYDEICAHKAIVLNPS